MKLRVSTDNRGGSVSVKSGKADPRDDNYNLDPTKRYSKLTRTLSEASGSGGSQISSTLETGDGKEVLAQTKAYVLPVEVGEAKSARDGKPERKPVKATYGTFTMSFTGGAGVRAK